MNLLDLPNDILDIIKEKTNVQSDNKVICNFNSVFIYKYKYSRLINLCRLLKESPVKRSIRVIQHNAMSWNC